MYATEGLPGIHVFPPPVRDFGEGGRRTVTAMCPHTTTILRKTPDRCTAPDKKNVHTLAILCVIAPCPYHHAALSRVSRAWLACYKHVEGLVGVGVLLSSLQLRVMALKSRHAATAQADTRANSRTNSDMVVDPTSANASTERGTVVRLANSKKHRDLGPWGHRPNRWCCGLPRCISFQTNATPSTEP